MKQLLVITILLFSMTVLFAQEEDVKEVPDFLEEKIGDEECSWPFGWEEASLNIHWVCSYGDRNEKLKAIEPAGSDRAVEEDSDCVQLGLTNYSNQIIETKSDFRRFEKILDIEVDWGREKVLFISELASFKFGKLESDIRLMGFAFADSTHQTLQVGYRSTFHGVCQGIAQKHEWFSSETIFYAVVIPAEVQQVSNTYCNFGPDCSDIP